MVLVAAGAVAQQMPQTGEAARRVDWWPRLEAIEETLARHKWKRGLQQVERLAKQAKNEAWSGPDLPNVIAELALQRAVLDINLGRPDDALWFWYAALTLNPELAQRDLSPYDLANRLTGIELRKASVVPREFDQLSDIDRLQMDPPVYPEVDPPDFATNAAAVLQRQPDLLIEAIVDERGRLRQPVLLSEDSHPVLVLVAFEWLAQMPPAEPARLGGEVVDALEVFNVSFALERRNGMVFLPPIETDPSEPPDD